MASSPRHRGALGFVLVTELSTKEHPSVQGAHRLQAWLQGGTGSAPSPQCLPLLWMHILNHCSPGNAPWRRGSCLGPQPQHSQAPRCCWSSLPCGRAASSSPPPPGGKREPFGGQCGLCQGSGWEAGAARAGRSGSGPQRGGAGVWPGSLGVPGSPPRSERWGRDGMAPGLRGARWERGLLGELPKAETRSSWSCTKGRVGGSSGPCPGSRTMRREVPQVRSCWILPPAPSAPRGLQSRG